MSKCPKIKYGNLPLDSYEFVEKGFQIMSEEKPIIFVVSDCKKYEKDTRIYANDSVKKLEKRNRKFIKFN